MTETDPTGRNPHEPGAKLDAGKPLPWLVFSGFARALKRVTDIGTYGAAKYTSSGWMTVPDAENRYMEAFMRHVLAHASGQAYDKDSGQPHLAHAAWNLLAVLELQQRRGEQVKVPPATEAVPLDFSRLRDQLQKTLPSAASLQTSLERWQRDQAVQLELFPEARS